MELANSTLLGVVCVKDASDASDVDKDNWYHKKHGSDCEEHYNLIWWETDIWGECQRMTHEDAGRFF